jgi:hypothetical protein
MRYLAQQANHVRCPPLLKEDEDCRNALDEISIFCPNVVELRVDSSFSHEEERQWVPEAVTYDARDYAA